MKIEHIGRIVGVVAGMTVGAGAGAEEGEYLAKVKPLLKERCYACHGSLKQKGELRLDTVELMMEGGGSGPAVEKGKPEESLLLERVAATDVLERMPPEHEGEPFTAEQVATIREWIAAGAPGPDDEEPEADPDDHWAFRPIVRPEVPREAGGANPIDAFVERELEASGLTANPEATRPELLRRLYLDLIGLPPDLDRIEAFEKDDAPDAYTREMERLLADPRHGERWGRHWMDVWRYSDWWGLGEQLRNSHPHIWHWRDWVVESLNGDRPYDEMVRSMLAADEISPGDADEQRATGYLARNYFLFNRNQWMDETVEHVAKGFLGLTMNCAKCHDHKYDPISQVEYYRLRAVFEPYQVRVDMRPGQADLARDGLARAFDAQPEAATYRFIRGDEARPDKSSVMEPGVPAAIGLGALRVEPVALPAEAAQPERRPWVIDAYEAEARAKLAAAEARRAEARSKRDGVGEDVAKKAEAELELSVAEAVVGAARAGLTSVESRADAMRVSWASGGKAGRSAREAAHAERELAVGLSKVALAEAKLGLHHAEPGKKDEATKAVTAAKEAMEKAVVAARETTEAFTKLEGARWVPTRFLDSTKDDPAVGFPDHSSGRRKALAEWVTDRRNPLTARVAANQIWARHMGTPLVPTVFDFGRKGTPPTNPELLDWLASELIDSGWSMKHLHRLIVGSKVYRRSSGEGAAESMARDPENAKLWRRTPTRIESQVVRDAILDLAGKLDGTMGGPPVPAAGQPDSARRSLYFFHSNNERNAFLTTFDEALVKECYRREQSIVPQQALALTNGRVALEAAGPIAGRLTRQLAERGSPDDDQTFARAAFLLLLGVEPTGEELEAMEGAIGEWEVLPEAGESGDAGQWARAQLVGVLLNHNDFVTLR